MLILCTIFPICVFAQQQTEYNKKGDEAMKRLDYSDARLFYGEGVPYCDMYSINQLTTIWLANERMRTSMHNLMNRCLSCLNIKATENDTAAVSKLMLYYSEGIGTPKSEELALYWEQRLDELRNPDPIGYGDIGYENNRRIPMQFFAGYSFSPLAPIGLTIGGVGEKFGWYGRFRTNASFQASNYEFAGSKPSGQNILLFQKKKSNMYSATAGLIVKCTSWFYASLGAGYGNRDLLYQYSTIDDAGNEIEKNWYKSLDNSYKGVSAEIDFMVRYGFLYITAGCNTLNFEYVDLNAGFGVFF